MQRLAPLKLRPVFNLKFNNFQSVSLIELFVTSTGGFEAHKLFSQTELSVESLAVWHTSLIPYTAFLTQLMYPFYIGNSLTLNFLTLKGLIISLT